jgi:hypothetical protein
MEYVGGNKTKIVVEEYDKHFFIPLLINMFKHLNPKSKPNPTLPTSSIRDSL